MLKNDFFVFWLILVQDLTSSSSCRMKIKLPTLKNDEKQKERSMKILKILSRLRDKVEIFKIRKATDRSEAYRPVSGSGKKVARKK